MKQLRGFVTFWYDFIVGDAWEVALGVVIALALVALVVRAGYAVQIWPLLPLSVALVLSGSLFWYARHH